jgi:hypothetical protein
LAEPVGSVERARVGRLELGDDTARAADVLRQIVVIVDLLS